MREQGDSPDAELKQQLSDAVAKAFESRLHLQQARMEQMQSKLDEIRTSVESREQNQDRIIERRVEELLNPDVEWQTLVPAVDVNHSPLVDGPLR